MRRRNAACRCQRGRLAIRFAHEQESAGDRRSQPIRSARRRGGRGRAARGGGGRSRSLRRHGSARPDADRGRRTAALRRREADSAALGASAIDAQRVCAWERPCLRREIFANETIREPVAGPRGSDGPDRLDADPGAGDLVRQSLCNASPAADFRAGADRLRRFESVIAGPEGRADRFPSRSFTKGPGSDGARAGGARRRVLRACAGCARDRPMPICA